VVCINTLTDMVRVVVGFVGCTDKLTGMVRLLGVFWIYRQTDRYGVAVTAFMVCSDRLTDMASLVGGLWVAMYRFEYTAVVSNYVHLDVRTF
jgi:hypothetical protein